VARYAIKNVEESLFARPPPRLIAAVDGDVGPEFGAERYVKSIWDGGCTNGNATCAAGLRRSTQTKLSANRLFPPMTAITSDVGVSNGRVQPTQGFVPR